MAGVMSEMAQSANVSGSMKAAAADASVWPVA